MEYDIYHSINEFFLMNQVRHKKRSYITGCIMNMTNSISDQFAEKLLRFLIVLSEISKIY